MLHSRRPKNGAFTLVELLVGSAVGLITGLGIFAMLYTSTSLSARNLSVNLTSNGLRGAVTRVLSDISLAESMTQPYLSLINTTGGTVAITSSAPGIQYDQLIGEPYVLTDSSGVAISTVAANTTTLTLIRSTNSLASPGLPVVKDVVLIGGTADSLRPVVTSVTTAAASGGYQKITVGVSGLNVAVTSGNNLIATIVRPVAYLVMPSGNGYELRYYSPFSNAPSTDPYVVITNQISTQTGETTPLPFSFTDSANAAMTTNSKPFYVQLSLSVRATNFDNWLKNKQADSTNTFAHIDTSVHPRVNP